jgi:hypothetical protein
MFTRSGGATNWGENQFGSNLKKPFKTCQTFFITVTRRVRTKVAGGRSVAKTAGKRRVVRQHPEGMPGLHLGRIWHPSRVRTNTPDRFRWSWLRSDHRLLSDSPSGCSQRLQRHAKGGGTVTAAAVFESQVATECAPAIVAGQACHPSSGGKVFHSCRRAYLARLQRTRDQTMAISAIQSLCATVLCMAESKPKGTRVSRGSRVWLLIVTNATRSDLPST